MAEPVSFHALCTAAPQVGEPIAEQLRRTGLMLLGTVRTDGSPRVSPVEVTMFGPDLIIGMMPDSTKAADVRRDRRVCLATPVAGRDDLTGEGKLFADLDEITEPAERLDAAAAAFGVETVTEDDIAGAPFFRVAIRSASWQWVAEDTFWSLAWNSELGVQARRRVGPVGLLEPVPDSVDQLPAPAAPATVTVAVVGAHLTGQPLNHQLTERGATLQATTTTAPHYRLVALDTTPPKPGLIRVPEGDPSGASIEIELWELSTAAFGSFVAEIPQPLGIGTVDVADGAQVCGFIAEQVACESALDITSFGGWRAYLASR